MCKITNDKIKEMLVEKVGHSIADSGVVYGYNHEMNDGVDFEALPSVVINDRDVSLSTEIDYSINVYHYLTSQLDLDDKFCKRVNNKLNEIREIANENDNVEFPHWDSECMSVVENGYSIRVLYRFLSPSETM